ncbi:hypothetical protein F4776DRAFT_615998 [Hypoxylon sp. NC0597]|nr:hypothetical protein F4776DRAFT_615998 [Hypoxylon sp. NC0597]
MSDTQNEEFLVAGGVGIFFGCGHRFIEAVDGSLVLDKDLEDRLQCPICHSHVCLVCGASFSGWLDSCGSCSQFCVFEAMADEAISRSAHRIRFKHGIILVPSVGNELTHVVGWTKTLLSGVGYVKFNEKMGADGDVYASEPMELEFSEILRPDEQGQSSHARRAEPLKIELRAVNTDVTPESEKHYNFIRLI